MVFDVTYMYADLSSRSGITIRAVRLVLGEDPKAVNTTNEAISLTFRNVVGSLNYKV